MRNFLEARIYEVSKIIRPGSKERKKKNPSELTTQFNSLRNQKTHFWVLLAERVRRNHTDLELHTIASDTPSQAKASVGASLHPQLPDNGPIQEEGKFQMKADTHTAQCEHQPCQILYCTNCSRSNQSPCPVPPLCAGVSSMNCINTQFLKCLWPPRPNFYTIVQSVTGKT